MDLAEVDLSDVQPRYAKEMEAFRAVVRAAARDIFWAHLREPLATTPLDEVRANAKDFGKRLLDYLLDIGDLVLDEDGRARPAPALHGRTPSDEAIAQYAAGDARRASVAYFVAACRDVAGGVLKGEDGFRLMRARDPRGLMERWESLMLEGPVLEPCRVFAARALASRLTAPRVVFEGGAGIGVVLRTLLADPALASRVDQIAAYHHTELDPALIAVGRAGLARVAPESLQRAIIYRRLDLDTLPGNPAASGLEPGSVDCVVLEHVLYDVADLHGTLVSLRELLTPDGALIFTGAFRGRAATFFPCEMLQLTLASYRRARLDPPYRTHVGYLTLREWSLSLERAGFTMSVHPAPEDRERAPHGGVIARPR